MLVDDLAPYGVSEDRVVELRKWIAAWRDDLARRLGDGLPGDGRERG
ncbi:hypothetical protein [Nonomuraea maritima]|nr:hypothetical protein [Nonomuraea maritima]